MSDRKAVIKNADMSEEMQQDAVECATQALEKYNIEKDIAAYIKKVTLNVDHRLVTDSFAFPTEVSDGDVVLTTGHQSASRAHFKIKLRFLKMFLQIRLSVTARKI